MHTSNRLAQRADDIAMVGANVGAVATRPLQPALRLRKFPNHRFVMSMLVALLLAVTTSGCTGPVEAAPDEPVLTLPGNQSATSSLAPGRPTLEAAWVSLTPEQQGNLCREFVVSPDDTYALRVAPNPDLSSVTYDTLRAFLTRACP